MIKDAIFANPNAALIFGRKRRGPSEMRLTDSIGRCANFYGTVSLYTFHRWHRKHQFLLLLDLHLPSLCPMFPYHGVSDNSHPVLSHLLQLHDPGRREGEEKKHVGKFSVTHPVILRYLSDIAV